MKKQPPVEPIVKPPVEPIVEPPVKPIVEPIIKQKSKQDKLIEVFQKHFPQALQETENGYLVDKEQLQRALEPKNCKVTDEALELRWVGKKEAYHSGYSLGAKIIQPLKNQSKDFENTGNVLIKGDNLDALKLLQNNYFERVKMIYIDPPYNTQNDGFIYRDNFSQTQEQILEELGYSKEDKEYIKNIAGAKTHSGWLSFIYPRLLLARELLRDDGVIFISIDDNEQANLKLLCDEVFGEMNFVALIIVKSNPGGRDYGGIAVTHEYVLVYRKTDITELNLIEDKNKKFDFQDNISPFVVRELRNRNVKFNIDNRPNLHYPFYVNLNKQDKNGLFEISLEKQKDWVEVFPLESQGIKTVWRWGKEKVLKNINIEVKAKKKQDGKFQIVEKYRSNFKRERSIFDEKNVRNEAGTLSIKEIFVEKNPFGYPKSIFLIQRLINLGADKNDIILDFFAGSGTTGDAVMRLNAEDGGNRRFVLVQQAEAIDKKKNKEAYEFVQNELKKEPTIFEIAAERLRRAGAKIEKEQKEKPPELQQNNPQKLDTGFRIFELTEDSKNKIYPVKKSTQTQLIGNLPKNTICSDETILYNMLLGAGFSLDQKINCLIKDACYLVKEHLFILQEFDLDKKNEKSKKNEAILEKAEAEYAHIYNCNITDDEFTYNLTKFIKREKITLKEPL